MNFVYCFQFLVLVITLNEILFTHNMRKVLTRLMSENLFKDAEGRFKTRWHSDNNPNAQIQNVREIPNYKAKIDFPFDKKRIFDFDLPSDMAGLEPPLQIWAMADGMFSVNNVWL